MYFSWIPVIGSSTECSALKILQQEELPQDNVAWIAPC